VAVCTFRFVTTADSAHADVIFRAIYTGRRTNELLLNELLLSLSEDNGVSGLRTSVPLHRVCCVELALCMGRDRGHLVCGSVWVVENCLQTLVVPGPPVSGTGCRLFYSFFRVRER